VIAAVVALAIALAAAVGGLIALAVKAISAERRCGDARSDESAVAVRFESMTKQRDDAETRADDERKRANALDDLLAEMAASGPVDGAYQRLLSKWKTTRARGDAAPAVPAPSAPAASDELMRPGD
jgi:hypothetical protein